MFRKDLFTGIALFGVTVASSMTGAYAFYKIIPSTAPVKQVLGSAITQDTNNMATVTNGNRATQTTFDAKPTQPSSISNTTRTANTNSTNPSKLTASSNNMTLAELANHNKTGDCYISYKGSVYDVSSQLSWSGCFHHGARGGRDITAIFPHPTSYLAMLPKVGNIVSTSNTTTPNRNRTTVPQRNTTIVKKTAVTSNNMTLAELANHNKTGDCYISYKGSVYDVSSQLSWSGCFHHGARGGRDITAIFPHPTSYLAILPKVGNIVSTSNTTIRTTPIRQNRTDRDEDRDRDEHKEHESYEYEASHDRSNRDDD